ncbi:hypothetical protein DMQ18_17260 [Klebsiella pneumoniae]|nr:hypothetical protein DMQ18_17260 [Klebsiella pneumoniae]
MPENPASYRVVRTKSYLFNKALLMSNYSFLPKISLMPLRCKKFYFVIAHKSQIKKWRLNWLLNTPFYL